MTATLELPQTERPTLALARLLANRPDLDEAARLLVALLCWPIGAEGCYIVRSTGSGFDVLGRYVESTRGTVDAALATDIDRLVQIAEHKPEFWTRPLDPDATPMAAWPLGNGHDATLVLLLSEPRDAETVLARVGDLIDIFAVYIAGILAASDPRNGVRRNRHVTSAPNLSDRQLQTLQLIERNLTMRQIASRIGFSESTVRMESLAIYRALGVHDRREAVAVGRKLGLLAQISENVSG